MERSIQFKIKELARHGAVFGLTSSLQNVLGFVLLPILTAYYTTSDFGVYSIILLANALAGAIFYLGASSALGRFYYDVDDATYRKKIVSAALFITLLGAALLALLAFALGRTFSVWLFHTPAYTLPLELMLCSAAFTFLLNTMTLVLRYEKRSGLFMIVVLTGVLLNFAITYILLTRYRFGILAPIYGAFCSNGLCFLFLLTMYLRKFTLFLNRGHVRQIVVFGIQSSLSGLLFYLLDWVDRLIIKGLLPMSDVGIYSLGYRLGAVMNILLIVPFSLIWAPLRMQYAGNLNNNRFVAKVISYFSIVGLSIVLVAVLFGKDLMDLFFKNPDYAAAAKVYPIIMLSMWVFGFQNILDFGIYMQKKVYFFVIVSAVGLAFNIVMNYWLIPHFGYIAAAYVTLLTYTLTTLLIHAISSRYHRLKIEWRRVLWPLLYLIGCYWFVNFPPVAQTGLLLWKILLLVVALGLFFIFWLDTQEVRHLKKFVYGNS
ncbi:MAG TPA: polysaccharide biosynthesis C-terminal domain-containing protein [Dinghuibacter sp.]|jgi:O-antigen/teichoic acid export membrane protein|uniref:lipopolysaccharide biosynthesis protein n=1 Tax=Dinghuibacter sp. TaxID=2024697 RepID=UPI002CFFD63B|nr:polysaccharide biosynthesis C-terminal domain-containing protein [Dinghuibacter sp.]HTJ10955.1 polysaccharide biosynthesis C-terminal domain-containing protein [Dinghuibacter sp.]